MSIFDMDTNRLEEMKNKLILRYIELQDIIDSYNKQVYEVCLEVETINAALDGKKAAGSDAPKPKSSSQELRLN